MADAQSDNTSNLQKLRPGDPGYPTAEQLARLRGKPVPNVQVLLDDMGEGPEDDELEELLSYSGSLAETEQANAIIVEVREALREARRDAQ